MPLQAKPIGGQLKATPPPSNPKYAKIKAKLDTGYNELKIKTCDLKANARFHRGENFRRLKVSGLIAVLQDPVVDVLLLDLRDEDDFAQYHITGAVNYPIRLLSRQVNPFTAEILAYINGAPDKVIVLIDLDEHMACNAGNSFYEKQVDNVYIVTGGTISKGTSTYTCDVATNKTFCILLHVHGPLCVLHYARRLPTSANL